jgi:hypothetical protein
MNVESNIHELLDQLRAAFIAKGQDVDSSLQPGLSRAEILEKTRMLGFPFPEELIQLYTWRNGQSERGRMSFSFRDNLFINLDRALAEYVELAGCSAELNFEEHGFHLKQSFPFAAFDGSWHVLVCAPHRLNSPHERPVVNVFHDVCLFFHSFESMLRTCVDWVRDPHWTTGSGLGLSEDVEMMIWKRHNPGIFE